jgi:hypothetical protein
MTAKGGRAPILSHNAGTAASGEFLRFIERGHQHVARGVAAHAVAFAPADESGVDAAQQNDLPNQPTSLSAKAVMMAVPSPKQRRTPCATLYTPPPYQAWNERGAGPAVVRIEAKHDLAKVNAVELAGFGRA